MAVTSSRRLTWPARSLTLLAIALFAISWPGSAAAAPRHRSHRAHRTDAAKPTIVLVHGAWADSSGWNGVSERLQNDGYTVIAPANPLRGVGGDSEYLASVLATLKGPIVLVGHSYGGMVITNAAKGNPNVKALVYVAAFVPEEGETLAKIEGINPGSELTPQNLTFRPYAGGLDVYISPSKFHEVFCGDLSGRTSALMAGGQRPLAAAALEEPSGAPAWKTIPSWYMVAREDHAIPAATERFMAKRAHAHTVEVQSSHVAMISHPDAVTELILSATHSTS